jgi:hypothetical protein
LIKLTEEQYKIAESNGIDRRNLRQRVYRYGMSVEEAIKEPLKNFVFYQDEITELRKKNGINEGTFYSRVKKGMNPKEAATIQPMTCKQRYGDIPNYLTPEQWALAKKNEISKSNLYKRIIVMKWDVEKAINTPIKKKI